MTANPWISIVIPAWNREDTIARCLDSILAQRFTDYEILVVDDGSTDGTADIVRSYDDPRVHLIQHDRNRGSYAARATAIGQSRGAWVLVVGSDDALCPGALEKMAAMAGEVSPGVGVIGLSYRYTDGSSGPDPAFPAGETGFEGWLAWLNAARRVDFLTAFRRPVLEEVPMPSDGRGSLQMMMRIASRWRFRVDADEGGLVYDDAPNRLNLNGAILLRPEAMERQAVMNDEVLEEFGPMLRRLAPQRHGSILFVAGRWYFLAGRRWKGARRMLAFIRWHPLSARGWACLVLGLVGPGALVWAQSTYRGRKVGNSCWLV